MRKAMFTLALAVMAMAASAQTVKVGFKKGDVRKYVTKVDITVGVPMQGEEKVSSEATNTYTVTDATADGYTVELKNESYTTTGKSEIAQQLGDVSSYFSALKETPAKLKLNKDGAVTDILNSDAVLASISKIAIDAVNKFYADHPEIEKQAPKSKALMAVNDQITKENALNLFKDNTIFSLNGKDLVATPEEDDTIINIIKVKSTYSVSNEGSNLVINKKSVSNMSEDDLKALIKKFIAKAGQEVSDSEFDQMWGQMKLMGMAQIDANETGTSNYGEGGWLTSNSDDVSMTVMGAKTKVSIKSTLQ